MRFQQLHSSTCSVYMYTENIYWACILGMYAGHVYWECMLGMYTGNVYWACILGMYTVECGILYSLQSP